MGETRVDLHHLLEDLRDAYPGPLEETILTEIIANALDSGAGCIRLDTSAAERTFTVMDDGRGMQRREIARYHDIAASTKVRGQGIGFAGVGIKLGLLVCEEVLTETRRGKSHVATRWRLASRHRAPWKWTPPLGLVVERGTAVRLTLQNALSPLLDNGFLEAALRRHYEALFDPAFDGILAPHYPCGVIFVVNGRPVDKRAADATETALIEIRLFRKRKPSAVGYLARGRSALDEGQAGIAISTLGKVIKRGWDWLGLSPAIADRISGLIEVPALAEALTLNKADFIRVGARGASYLAYRKAIQEAVSRQLGLWGDARDPTEEARRRASRPVERDLERVLMDLAGDFPLLATLVERRNEGQRRLPIGRPSAMDDGRALVAASVALGNDAAQDTGCDTESRATSSVGGTTPSPSDARPPGPEAVTLRESLSPGGTALPGGRAQRRPASLGLTIQFEHRSDDPEPGRLVESTVWVNEAHPAYRRAAASRSEGYHIALAVALALAPLAADPAHPTGSADDGSRAAPSRRRHFSWAELLRRVFAIDVLACTCGGRLRFIATIEDPAVVQRILRHVGLPTEAPEPFPARPPPDAGGPLAFDFPT